MPGKRTKLILDTNIWVSFLISDRLRYLDNIIFGHTIQLVFSEELIEEFITVSSRAKFAGFFKENDIEKLLELFHTYGVLYKLKVRLKSAGTPKTTSCFHWQLIPPRIILLQEIKICLSSVKLGRRGLFHFMN